MLNKPTQITSFCDFNLSQPILKALERAGYEKPSPIQSSAIPAVFEGRDILGCAQTGTGKTAAYLLPIIQKMQTGSHAAPLCFRTLVLVPTRELAEQVGDSVVKYGKFAGITHCKVYGGVSARPQVRALETGVDILIATPGRLLDLFRQKKLCFNGVEILVLDEADRMLDMGFINDIRKICSMLPKVRQSMLFSATLSPEIQELSSSIVKNPIKISVTPEKPTVEKIDQKLYFVEEDDKVDLLKHVLDAHLKGSKDALALVFCRTKHGSNKLVKRLSAHKYRAAVIHGNKSQSARKNALQSFKSRECPVLVATDIAARGIDVKDMSLVVNFDLPEEPETYVHRIGRTARADASGEAVTFFTAADMGLLRAIERIIKIAIPEFTDSPFHSKRAFEVKLGKQKGDAPRKKGGRQAMPARQSQRSSRPSRGDSESASQESRSGHSRTDAATGQESRPRQHRREEPMQGGRDIKKTIKAGAKRFWLLPKSWKKPKNKGGK